jgi:HK97 family phage portal protein
MNLASLVASSWRAFLYGGVKSAYVQTETWEKGQPAYSPTNFLANVQYGYRRNELIYACIAMKADSAALPTLRAYSRRTDKEIPDHPVRAVITRPNPYMTEFDLWSISLMMLDLAGRCYWEKQRSKAGRVVGLWPLRPDWVQPIRGGSGLPVGYQYAVPGRSQPVPLDAADVLEFKLWDPIDLYSGLAPVSVAGRVGDVDNAATDFLKKFFDEGGIPPGVLSSKLKLTDQAVGDIRRRWKERYGGWKNWTEPAVLDSEATFQRTGLTFAEMGFDVLDARSEARICAILRMPPILVGAKVGLDRSTFSNYAEARKAWWQDDLTPQYRRLGDEAQNDLASEFGSDVVLRWDFSQVPALQEDRQTAVTLATVAWKADGLKLDEYREAIGKPVDDTGRGALYYTEHVSKLKPAPPPQLQLPAPKPGQMPPEQEEEEEEQAAKSLQRKQEPQDDPPEADASRDERRKAERKLQAELEAYFYQQRKQIAAIAAGS